MASGTLNAADTVKENTLLEDVGYKLDSGINDLQGLAQRLEAIADRIIGQSPKSAEAAGKASPPPCALLTKFERSLDNFEGTRSWLSSSVSRLERL